LSDLIPSFKKCGKEFVFKSCFTILKDPAIKAKDAHWFADKVIATQGCYHEN